MSKFLLLSFFALVDMNPLWAQTDSCSKADFTHEVGPVRDQGDTGWCFAYTAADILTQKLRKTNPQKFADSQVSALDVTFQYLRNGVILPTIPRTDSTYWKQRFKKRDEQKAIYRQRDIASAPYLDKFKNGFSDVAIHSYQDNTKGVCLEKDLPSDRGMTKEIITAVNQRFKEQALVCRDDQPLDLQDFVEIRNKAWEMTIEEKCKRVKSEVSKVVQSMDTAVYDSFTATDGTFAFTYKDDDGNTISVTDKVREELKSTIDAGLSKGNIVALGINPAFLMNEATKKRMLAQHARHDLSIVAREKIGNQCFYRLRNSWGKDCSLYGSPFKERCKDGQIWVTDSELLPFTMRAHYLE